MKHILILAQGAIAKHFIGWISKKRVTKNHYHVVTYDTEISLPKNNKNISFGHTDPTSFCKIKNILQEVKYSHIFIVMEEIEDVKYTLKNIRMIDERLRVVLLKQWEDSCVGKWFSNTTIIDMHDLTSAHLYSQLPNVPVIAKNIGLGQGEIMEIQVPFGSSYAFRHLSSVVQNKWKIVALYRDEKQIIPTGATMIRPNDTIIVMGRPMVLESVYRSINKRKGLFPEPFGKNLYLILDFRYDQSLANEYLNEAINLISKLQNKELFVRIFFPTNFQLLQELKNIKSDKVTLMISYSDTAKEEEIVEYDIHKYDIGMCLCSVPTFKQNGRMKYLYKLRKLVYLFGATLLGNIEGCVVAMNEEEKMESISSTAFDVAESLGFKLLLCDFDPEGDFESRKMTIQHYEALRDMFDVEVEIHHKVANPIREISKMQNIIQIAPFDGTLQPDSLWQLFSMQVSDFLLTTHKHPKLLIPFEASDT